VSFFDCADFSIIILMLLELATMSASLTALIFCLSYKLGTCVYVSVFECTDFLLTIIKHLELVHRVHHSLLKPPLA
jgi:hypothetical protein